MTKPLDSQLSERAAHQPRSGRRPRTWLVALLGFGAADLLVLNLWAVPKLITNTTTTDMRAAHSGEAQAPQPEAAAVVPGETPARTLTAREVDDRAQHAAVHPGNPAEQDDDPASSPRQDGNAEGQQREQAAEHGGSSQYADSEQQQVALAAQPGVIPSQPGAQAARYADSDGHQPPGAQQGSSSSHHGARTAQLEQPLAAPQGETSAQQADPKGTTPEPSTEEAQIQRAPRAEPRPGGAPPQPPEVQDLPADPAVARAFAIRAAQRAMRVALQDRAAYSGRSAFEALTEADQPITQIFFSLGNYTLGPNGKQLLERKLPLLTGDERPILIVGAADPSGTEQINEKLSDARAQSVAEWLLTHGVDAQRIQTHAIGHEGAVGSTLDRRVDIWLGGSR